VTATIVTRVERRCVTAIQEAHPPPERDFTLLDQQVIVRVHQAEAETAPTHLSSDAPEGADEEPTIVIVAEERRLVEPVLHHVMERTEHVNARFARHVDHHRRRY
jgi:hypothetical protein